MTIDLLAIDVDGTLLADDFIVPEPVVSSLRNLEKSGVTVVLVTARGPSGVRPVHKQLNTSMCVVCFNGAWIGSLRAGGITVKEIFIDKSTSIDLWQTAKNMALEAILYSGTTAFTDNPTEYVKYELSVTGESVRSVNNFKKGDYHAHKLMLCSHDLGRLSDFRKQIATVPYLSISMSESGLLEVTALGADKASAIRFLAKKFGTSMSKVAAIGDNENDIELLKEASIGIAVANARKEVKAIAQWTVASNIECGVADAVDKLMACKI